MSGTFLFVVLVGRHGSTVFPATARKMTANEKRMFSGGGAINLTDKKREVPDFDTIEELAEFWDAHDSTDLVLRETTAVFERP